MFTIAQMNVVPGNPEANLEKILSLIEQAKLAGHDGIVFPEMAIPGYLLGDEWENESYVQECTEMNKEIIAATRDRFTAIWWNVSIDEAKKWDDGRLRKYNSAYVAHDGNLVSNWVFDGMTHKTLMPKYRLFDDERHFHSLSKLAQEEGKKTEDFLELFEILIDNVKRKVGIIICEDMWDTDYPVKPIEILKEKWAEIIINLSTSPFWIGKSTRRKSLMARHSQGVEFLYTNAIGTQNNGKNVFLFDGWSAIYRDWKEIIQAEDFTEGLLSEKDFTRHCEERSNLPQQLSAQSSTIENQELDTILSWLITGFRAAFEATKAKKFVIGLSGGIDSALVTALAVLALGKDKVLAINMPSEYNSETTKNLAKTMATNLGIDYQIIGIQESIELTKSQIENTLGLTPSDFVMENIQARDRGSRILAGVAATVGWVFSNNGNKSETAVGYATLYGDVNGFLAPIADLYKTQIYELCRHINAKYGDIIPEKMLTIVPSAELGKNQNVDEWKWDPLQYEYHDKLFYQLIEMRRDPDYILEKFTEGILESTMWLKNPIIWSFFPTKEAFIHDLERIYSLLKINFFKRVQCPPILTVSKRAFGYDLREAQNGVYYTRKYRNLKKSLLAA